jgi:hypothetical protein
VLVVRRYSRVHLLVNLCHFFGQGRLPIRVELKGLVAADFYRILTEPDNNMILQQQVSLGVCVT